MTTTIPTMKLRRRLQWFAVDCFGSRHAGRVSRKKLDAWLAVNSSPTNWHQFTRVQVFDGGTLVEQREIELAPPAEGARR